MKNSKYFPSFRQRASVFLLALLLLPTLAPVPLVAMIPTRQAGVSAGLISQVPETQSTPPPAANQFEL